MNIDNLISIRVENEVNDLLDIKRGSAKDVDKELYGPIKFTTIEHL